VCVGARALGRDQREDSAHQLSATPTRIRVDPKLVCSRSEEPEVAYVTGAKEPGAEPDPGRSRYPIVSRRLARDASRVVMRHEPNGRVVEVGARTRTIPPALRRALLHRDQGCRFPGCGLAFVQGHHLRHWAQGGPTTLSNLALLCRRHHRAVHEEGYQVERELDGYLRFRRPDGRLLPEAPAAAAVPADPMHALRARHHAQGLQIHPRTMRAEWLGEPLDVGWPIDVLHPLALGESTTVATPQARALGS
jgi:5-methylcytosine-specific restriction endonuclease McrA